jgi:N-acetylmuramoyl-L-alanine amidase
VRALVIAIGMVLGLAVASTAPEAYAAGELDGLVVVIDPGHGGGDGGALSRQVPNGRGGTKDCGTTGTSTDAGYPEHVFAWEVANLVRTQLDRLGATTVMTRSDDSGSAPCVDARAAMANAAHPAAIISIHADGAPASGHGFHVNYSAPPRNEVQAGPSVQLATAMRDALAASGLTPSTYLGVDGLYGRADLAGLNLAEHPATLVELGNMRNADDAARMTSDQGRADYAAAVVRGTVAFLRPAA